MDTVLSNTELPDFLKRADRAAVRLCRRYNLPWFDADDARQDLLLDLLCRIQNHDPGRGPLWNFATICFNHRAHRLELVLRRERRARHQHSLDDVVPGAEPLTLADTLSNEDGLGPCMGQDGNPIAEAELRHDLDRALSALTADIVPICAAVLRPGAEGNAALSRTTRYRRVRELRCQLLALGVGHHRETTAECVGR